MPQSKLTAQIRRVVLLVTPFRMDGVFKYTSNIYRFPHNRRGSSKNRTERLIFNRIRPTSDVVWVYEIRLYTIQSMSYHVTKLNKSYWLTGLHAISIRPFRQINQGILLNVDFRSKLGAYRHIFVVGIRAKSTFITFLNYAKWQSE